MAENLADTIEENAADPIHPVFVNIKLGTTEVDEDQPGRDRLMWPFRNRKKAPTSLPSRYDRQRIGSCGQSPGHLRARYDAAQTTVENARHWAMADGLSVDASMTPDVRRTLRNRAHYEAANNSYAKGMVLTVAGDCMGTGPRLQLLSEDDETNRIVEQAFAEWALAVDLAAKLRTMRMAKLTDGEAFAVLVNNTNLQHRVKLDLRLLEADQITTPVTAINRPDVVDGIELDRHAARRMEAGPNPCGATEHRIQRF